jgi:uncharacterized protein (TIGR03067 family)
MYRFLLSVVGLTVACVSIAEEPSAMTIRGAKTKEQSSFAGTWKITEVQPEGATQQAVFLSFTKVGIYSVLDKDGKELWAGTYEVVPTTRPKAWDHRPHDAAKAGKDHLGIYELEGDILRLACVGGQWRGNDWIGRPRPKAVDPREADVVLELCRVNGSRNTNNLIHQRKGDTMVGNLPKLAAEYIRATNESDPPGFMALFDEYAVIDDAGRFIRGSEAIRHWAAHDIFAAAVKFDVLEVGEYESGVTLTAKVDGTFDRTGLPDPLIMTFDIAYRDGRIAKLTCRLADR